MGGFDIERVEMSCDTHGPYMAGKMRKHISGCPACLDEKQRAQEEARQAEMEQERRKARADWLLGKAAIPPRFTDRRLSNFVATADGPARALRIASEYAENFAEKQRTGASLVFCGGVGAGKTHLAIGIAQEVIRQNKVAVFTSVIGAIRSVKDTYRKGSEDTERDAIENLVLPDLLILDEVGVQFGSDAEKLIMFEIINGRYEALKPTIVISNLALKQVKPTDAPGLTEYLGERVMDRLREGGGKAVVFDWPSYRSRAA